MSSAARGARDINTRNASAGRRFAARAPPPRRATPRHAAPRRAAPRRRAAPGRRAACAEPNACPVFAAVMCRAEVDNRGLLIG